MIYIVLAAALAMPFPPAASNSINVEIGGVMSGPSRTYVDLDNGVLLTGSLSGGDGVGIATRDLAVSASFKLSEKQKVRLRKLADSVLTRGVESRKLCQPGADRIVVLTVANLGRSTSGVVYCPSAEANALLDALFEASTPE